MRRRLTKKEVLTIPNIMSFFRIALIPLYLWLYCEAKEYGLAIIVLLISGLSDILDGVVARKFNMVSDFGKFIDPVADKLTQAALILSLSIRYPDIIFLFAEFAVFGITMGIVGFIVFEKTDIVNSAQWFGKMSTVVLEVSMAILILFVNIPQKIADILFMVCGAIMLFSFINYIILFVRTLKKNKNKK